MNTNFPTHPIPVYILETLEIFKNCSLDDIDIDLFDPSYITDDYSLMDFKYDVLRIYPNVIECFGYREKVMTELDRINLVSIKQIEKGHVFDLNKDMLYSTLSNLKKISETLIYPAALNSIISFFDEIFDYIEWLYDAEQMNAQMIGMNFQT